MKTLVFLGILVSSVMSIEWDARGREVFTYTCVYSDHVVIEHVSHCPYYD